MKKLMLAAAAFVAAVAVLVALTIPPRRLALQPLDAETVPGILHIHTNRSDGTSGPEEIAAAAARAGLKFIVFTDHGDATRVPDPPQYRSGVLGLDAGASRSTGGVVDHWAALTTRHRVVTVVGTDAHARLGLRGDPADSRWVLPLPGYEASFRTVSVRVRPNQPLTGNADADASLVLRAIRDGH